MRSIDNITLIISNQIFEKLGCGALCHKAYVSKDDESRLYIKANSLLIKSEIDKFPHGGIPQGNPISSVLSNLYLYELDKLAISKGWKMVRYADDMVLSVSNTENAKLVLEQIAKYLLENRKLTIHPLENSSDAKTAIFLNPKQDRMKYLGVIFDGQNLFPTNECCYQLIRKIKTILKGTLTIKEKETTMKTSIAQWCGYYAFTDIPNGQIKWMDNPLIIKLRNIN